MSSEDFAHLSSELTKAFGDDGLSRECSVNLIKSEGEIRLRIKPADAENSDDWVYLLFSEKR